MRLASALLALSLAAAHTSAADFKDVFTRRYPLQRAHGVVLQPSIPTRSAYDVGIKKHARHYVIEVVDGEWRAGEFVDQLWEESFERGELVRLTALGGGGHRLDLRLESVKEHYVPGGLLGNKGMRRVATLFRLSLPFAPTSDQDVARVIKHLEPLVRLFPSEEEAKAYAAQFSTGGIEVDAPGRPSSRGEVQVGMSQEEVFGLLGAPRDKVGRGARAEWRYPDRTVLFLDNKVTSVRFH